MKTSAILKGSLLVAAIAFVSNAYAWKLPEKETSDTINMVAYSGKILDSESSRPLPFATIEAMESNAATVSNIDGEFVIKIPREANVTSLKISYIGFSNKFVKLSQFNGNRSLSITMDPTSVQLEEIVVRPQDALSLIMEALNKIRVNYSEDPMMMRAFYRETIRRGRNYVSISEAVVDIFKSSYSNDFQIDQMKLFKGRKSADVEKMDTVLFKVQGGPNTAILLDVVKNPYILLSSEFADIYDFRLTDVIAIDDRLHYVISFDQKPYVDDPYYTGKLYVDMEKLAITEAEFELNTENREEAARLFIQRKPAGMTVIPDRAAYRAKYTCVDGRWFFSYARAEVVFKVNWNKKLFNTTYSTMSEIAVTDRTYEGIEKFAAKERFKRSDILDEKVYTFFDENFWSGYNVIEPDQSIESAIRRLNRKFLKRSDSDSGGTASII